MLQGALTAMITPFRGDEVDFGRLSENVTFQIERGIDGLVPVGTTGESPTLSHAEHREVIERVVEVAAGRVPVVAGTGSNSTSEALELTKHARRVGASAALMVNPYYNKPTQEGLYRHFMTVADAVDLPIVLYNIPGRTGITMSAPTIARLASHEHIVAVKEATGSMDMASEIAGLCDPASLAILSGDDSLTLPLMSLGARGVISVLSNLIPDRVKALTDAALEGDLGTARQVHYELFPLCRVMFIETNPIPIKTAMAMAGRDSGDLRLPLCEMFEANRQDLESTLRARNLV
ncbi:MAG: 4-hydroxy-tetrahydrodipicolinate synthase [Phycisphaeraceae bacterium]|nr:4-hydroxy-tetrahydrodipicolinate synthase [Phycisphaeraceae bacterium]